VRKLKCFQIGGFTVQDVLDEFNERRERGDELFDGISDSDILSVSASPPTLGVRIARPDGGAQKPKIEVVIVYWSDK
jgi:hypothetical protein